MGVATEQFRQPGPGQPVSHIGWKCEFGHLHPSKTAAEECTADKFAKENLEKLNTAEKQRVRSIQEDKGYSEGLRAAKQLGAADDDVAEECVLRNGIEAVTSTLEAVRRLGIKKPDVIKAEKAAAAKKADAEKKASDPKGDDKPTGESKPGESKPAA